MAEQREAYRLLVKQELALESEVETLATQIACRKAAISVLIDDAEAAGTCGDAGEQDACNQNMFRQHQELKRLKEKHTTVNGRLVDVLQQIDGLKQCMVAADAPMQQPSMQQQQGDNAINSGSNGIGGIGGSGSGSDGVTGVLTPEQIIADMQPISTSQFQQRSQELIVHIRNGHVMQLYEHVRAFLAQHKAQHGALSIYMELFNVNKGHK